MAKVFELPTHTDQRGSLTVIEKIPGIKIRRVFFIYGSSSQTIRGGHKHVKNRQVLVCVHGHCTISVQNRNGLTDYFLNDPSKALLLEPQDWHEMSNFSQDAVLLVVASEYYDKSDYINEV